MLQVEEALSRILDLVSPLGTEWVSVAEAIGRVTAEAIVASKTVPPWNNSAMDGYAVRSEDVRPSPVRLRITEVIYAGRLPKTPVKPGTCSRIFTGAAVPPGADAVVMQEKTRADGEWVEILESVSAGAFIRPEGEDSRKGELLIAAETPLGIPEAGLLWS